MRCTGKLREKKIRFARSLINDGNVPIFSGFKITICMFPSRKFTNAKITIWIHINEMNSQLDGMPNDCKSMAFEMIIFSIVHWLPWQEIWAGFFPCYPHLVPLFWRLFFWYLFPFHWIISILRQTVQFIYSFIERWNCVR